MREVAVRWAGFVAALLAGGMASKAMAQEPAPSPEKAPRHRFFRAPIDLWGKGLTLRRTRPTSLNDAKRGIRKISEPDTSATDTWGSVVRLPNGEMSFQSLPAPLVAVLEDPTPEKVEAYFTWRLRRTAKIMRAAEAIKAYRAELLGVNPDDATLPVVEEDLPMPKAKTPPAQPSVNPQGGRLIYFHKKGCPHCDTQDVILAEWLGKHPEVTLEVVEFGERPELWRRHRVRGTPSIYMEIAGSDQGEFLEGLASKEELDRSLARCKGRIGKASTDKGGTR